MVEANFPVPDFKKGRFIAGFAPWSLSLGACWESEKVLAKGPEGVSSKAYFLGPPKVPPYPKATLF